MANCKDCLGFEFCLDRLGTTKYYDNAIAANNVEELCQKFKDRNRFVELPCKVGDTIYEITERKRNGKWNKVIVERVVNGIEIGRSGFMTVICGTTITVFLFDLGKTVFLTREEAERALNGTEKSDS